MSQLIQIRRGLKVELPLLAEGEMGFCTDTKEIYIGTGNLNTPVNNTYTHTQLTASNSWTIQHNLNKYPQVTVVDSAGSVVVGDIDYISVNEVVVSFQAAFSGQAYLN